MFAKKPRICVLGSSRQSNLFNSLFIQKVREEERRDKILEDVFMQSTEENPYHKKIQSAIQLCEAIKEEKTKNFVKGRRDLIRRGTNVALRKLENQLRATYVSKAISAQRFEAQQMEIEEKAKVHSENLGLELARMNAIEVNKETVEQKQKSKDALKRDLQEQMAYSEAKRQKEKLNVLEDKKMMDEAVRKYREEEMNKLRAAFDKKVKYKRELAEFDKVQEEWKTRMLAASQNAGVRTEELYKQQQKEVAEGKMKKKAIQLRKHEISEEMGRRTHKLKEEKIKVFDNLTELLIDERQAKDEMKFLRDQEKQKLAKQIVRSDLQSLIEGHEQKRQQERRADEELYQEELRLLAERDRLQALADEKRRQKKEEHRNALLHALAQKQFSKAKEMKALVLEHNANVQDEERREELVKQAAAELIIEHAPGLKGFFPRRLLRSIDPALLSGPTKKN